MLARNNSASPSAVVRSMFISPASGRALSSSRGVIRKQCRLRRRALVLLVGETLPDLVGQRVVGGDAQELAVVARGLLRMSQPCPGGAEAQVALRVVGIQLHAARVDGVGLLELLRL